MQLTAKLVLVFSACFLASCSTVKTVYTPTKVEVLVPVQCLNKEDIPEHPKYAMTEVKETDSVIFKALSALKEIEQRIMWQQKAEALLNQCATEDILLKQPM